MSKIILVLLNISMVGNKMESIPLFLMLMLVPSPTYKYSDRMYSSGNYGCLFVAENCVYLSVVLFQL